MLIYFQFESEPLGYGRKDQNRFHLGEGLTDAQPGGRRRR